MFSREADYAYFAVRLHWTPEEYGSLTPVQLAFVRKELETYEVRRSELARSAVEVAVANAMRKKGAKAQELWRKASTGPKEPPVSKKEFQAIKAAFAAMRKRRGIQGG